jgi:glutamate dehydrogenase/leucine dehydrogenase
MNQNIFLKRNPQKFINHLKAKNITRFYFIYDFQKKEVISSHAELQEITDFVNSDKRDFSEHEGLFFQISKQHDLLMGAFIHRTKRGQAAGGVRFWTYENMGDYLRDGLRLAKGMTVKNALAGLWWGGGKGVIAHNPTFDKNDHEFRKAIYRDYGAFITSLQGCYVTAEDVGTHVTDMENIFSQTRFTTCIPESLGGSGNPSIPTARGVISGMEAALYFQSGESLKKKTVAVQGAGNVGEPLIGFLFERGVKKVTVSDINQTRLYHLMERFKDKNLRIKLAIIDDDSILEEECDILSPSATGAILNERTIPNIKARIICGAANNQLEDAERDDLLLYKRGIIYIPDFLTNRMGIVNCANEQYGFVNDDPYIEKHLNKEWKYSIYQTSLQVLNETQKSNLPPAKVALKLAEKLSKEEHPIFGHRGLQIIDSLRKNNWHINHSLKSD